MISVEVVVTIKAHMAISMRKGQRALTKFKFSSYGIDFYFNKDLLNIYIRVSLSCLEIHEVFQNKKKIKMNFVDISMNYLVYALILVQYSNYTVQ